MARKPKLDKETYLVPIEKLDDDIKENKYIPSAREEKLI